MKIPYNYKDKDHNDPKKYKIYSGSVYDHVIEVLKNSNSNNPLVNISCLFHDVGKPATAGVNDVGQPIYHGHEEQSVKIFENIARRLKFSNDEINAIKFVIGNHMRAYKLHEMNKNKVLQMRQSPYWDMLKQMMIADQLARGGSLIELNTNLDNVEKMIKTFGEKQEFEKRISALINGNMIINKAKEFDHIFTKNNSNQIGIIKNKIRDLIIKKDFNITQEEIQKYLEELILEIKQGDTNANNISRFNTNDTSVHSDLQSSNFSSN